MKKIFLIGTGPSLKDIDVSKLSKFDTLTYNRAYIAFSDWGFDPTYYVAIDGNDNRSIYKDLNQLAKNSSIKKMFLVQTTDNDAHLPQDFQDNDQVKDNEMYCNSGKIVRVINNYSNRNFNSVNESFDSYGETIDMFIEPNAGFFSMKLMYNMGYREFYLIGHDARYQVDEKSTAHITTRGGQWTSSADADTNHFRPDYCGKGITFGRPNEETIVDLWKNFMPNASSLGIKIVSCSPISRLNSFIEYRDFDKVIEELNGSN